MKKNAGIILVLICSIQLLWTSDTSAQEVEHNYSVGPNEVTCDSIEVDFERPENAIKTIRATKFRFQQSFRLTRRQGFKGGEFYACDGITGYLIIRIDNEEMLYDNINKTVWEELTSSSDPEGYYLKKRSEFSHY